PASTLAYFRDWYCLNTPPQALDDGLQGFDLSYAVNCKNGIYNQEEGNYGKLLRIWQKDFQYQPPESILIYRTITEYLSFKNIVITEGFKNLAYLLLPKITGSNEIYAIHYNDNNAQYCIGWQSKNVCFILNSLFSMFSKERKNEILAHIFTNGANKIYIFSDKYASTEYDLDGSNMIKIKQRKKPKYLIRGLVEN
ncbi:MAG: hypothetical protein ACKPEO_14835, partial [Sphaerospermopsis kisseleviana]